MPRAFTATQAAADAIDCDLYRLMSRAEQMIENTTLRARASAESGNWHTARLRPLARQCAR